jgi:MFS family permease
MVLWIAMYWSEYYQGHWCGPPTMTCEPLFDPLGKEAELHEPAAMLLLCLPSLLAGFLARRHGFIVGAGVGCSFLLFAAMGNWPWQTYLLMFARVFVLGIAGALGSALYRAVASNKTMEPTR